MNRKIFIIVGLQAFLIIIMFWVIVFYGKDEYDAYTREQDEQVETPNRVSTELGATVVKLSPEAQQQSDIMSSRLIAGSEQTTLNSLGSAISIDPLIEMRTRYLTAIADANVTRASLANSQQEYQRLLQLNQDNRNVSDRVVMAAESLFKTDQAKLQAAQVQASNVGDTMRQLWGETLARQASQPAASSSLLSLLQYKEVLLQITLPFEAPPPRVGDTLWVSPAGSQGKPVMATYVSPSPLTDATLQGKTYYFRAPAESLRVGMRITVRMENKSAQPGAGVPKAGYIVPASAVVWYGGKSWVYKKDGSDKFTRLPVDTTQEAAEGWFNSRATHVPLKVGDEVVTSGAQLLLSEEFKYQIKNENED